MRMMFIYIMLHTDFDFIRLEEYISFEEEQSLVNYVIFGYNNKQS